MAKRIVVVNPEKDEDCRWGLADEAWYFDVSDDATDDQIEARLQEMKDSNDWSELE